MKRGQRHPIFGPTPSHADPGECFVLMPFTEKWSDNTWRAIRLALEDYKMNVSRADEMPGRIIMQDVWWAINSAGLIIADVTTKNANVFYELGIAHVQNKDVLLLSQFKSKEDVPFDIVPFRRIDYEPTRKGYVILRTGIQKALQKRGAFFVPLPPAVTIQRADKRLDPRISAYLGSWKGAWTGDKEGQLLHVLVVEKVEPSRAHVIYAWGDKPESNIRGAYRRLTGIIQSNQLRLEWPGVKIRYWFSKSHEVLHALREDSDGTFQAILRKVPSRGRK